MGIKIFNDDVNSVKIGTADINSAYIGTEPIPMGEPEPSWNAISFSSNWDGTCSVYRNYDVEVPATLVFPSYSPSGDKVIRVQSWSFNSNSRLKKVIFSDTITDIGEYAFYYCKNLEQIIIKSDTISIGDYAFEGCNKLKYNEYDNGYYLGSASNPYLLFIKPKSTSLTNIILHPNNEVITANAFEWCTSLISITFSNKLTKIEMNAFSNCSNLSGAIILPESLTTIDEYAFRSCSKIAAISLGKNITSIGYHVFSGCQSLTLLSISNENAKYRSENNCIIERETDKVITGTSTLQIPAGIKIIGYFAFESCLTLTDLLLPESLLKIEDYAFQNSSLTSINLPSKLTTIGPEVFDNCNSLTAIHIPANITDISERAFTGCTKLNTLTVAESNPKYYSDNNCILEKDTNRIVVGNGNGIISAKATIIGSYAFSGRQFNTITFSSQTNLKTIESYAFSNNSSITNLELAESIEKIESYAFCYSYNIKTIKLPENLVYIGNAFESCWNIDYTIFENGKYLGSSSNEYLALMSCTDKSSATFIINTNCKLLAGNVFKYYTNLTSIDLPNNLVGIGENAFANCSKLSNIILPDTILEIGRGAFCECYNLNNITLPKNLKTLNEYVFQYCYGLDTIIFNKNLKHILNCAFYGTKFTSIDLPHGLLSIGSNAFNADSLETIYIPRSVTTVSSYAFMYQDSLKNINCAADFKPSGWNNDWRHGCYNTKVTWGYAKVADKLTFISNGDNTCYVAGLGETDVPVFKIPDTHNEELVTSIGDGAFENEQIIKVVCGDNIISINQQAFLNCSSLAAVEIDSNCTTIQMEAFESCSSLTTIIIPNSVQALESNVFNNCNSLSTIYCLAAEKPSGWADNWLGNCTAIIVWDYKIPSKGLAFYSNGDGTCSVSGKGTWTGTNLVIPTVSEEGETVTAINYWAFSGNSTIESLIVYNSVTEIKEGAFYNCSALTSVSIADSVTVFGNRAFLGCNTAAYLLDNNIYYIGTISNPYFVAVKIVKDSAVTTCDIHSGTKIIDYEFSYSNYYLTAINFPEGLLEIRHFAFLYNYNIKNLLFPESLNKILSGAFRDCGALDTIYIGANCATLSDAFYESSVSSSITINPNNSYYTVINNCLIETAVNKLILAATTVSNIPDIVTSIGYAALCNNKTESLTIPTNVLSIDSDIFYRGYGVKNIFLPERLRLLSYRAFSPSGVETINLPSKLLLPRGGYWIPELKSININDNLYYSSINGNLIYTPTKKAIILNNSGVVPNGIEILGQDSGSGREMETLSLPSGLKEIKESALNWYNKFTRVTIPEGVETIDSDVFSNTSLRYISLPNSLKLIGSDVFRNCDITYTDSYYLGNAENPHLVLYKQVPTDITSFSINENCKIIGPSVFSGCTQLTEINIPEGVTTISDYAFYGCSNLTNISIPNSAEYFGNNIFNSCSNIKGTIYNNIKYIGNDSNLYLIAYKVIDSNATTYSLHPNTKIVYSRLFYNNLNLDTLTLPNTVVKILNYAFYSCSNLNSLTLSNSLITIGDGAFCNCDRLKELSLPDSLQYIDARAFENCSSLTIDRLPTSLKTIGLSTFSSTKIKLLNISAQLTWDFGNCSSDPHDRFDCSNSPFYKTTISTITVDSNNKNFRLLENNFLVDNATGIILAAVKNTDANVPEDDYAQFIFIQGLYYNNANIENVTIPDNIVKIKSNTYLIHSCENLKTISLSKNLYSIEGRLAMNCPKLTSIIIPRSVHEISGPLFWNCNNLTTIYCEAPTKPSSWSDTWLADCSATVVWGYEPQSIGLNYVSNNDGTCYLSDLGTCKDTNIIIPSKSPDGDIVVKIAESVFENQDQVVSITMADTIKEIDNYAFFGCTNLNSITLSNVVETIGNSAFANCNSLKNITLPETLKSIGSNAFHGCTTLTNITIPKSVETISFDTFSSCTSLVTINCEAESKPEGWADTWNYGCEAEVIWNS